MIKLIKLAAVLAAVLAAAVAGTGILDRDRLERCARQLVQTLRAAAPGAAPVIETKTLGPGPAGGVAPPQREPAAVPLDLHIVVDQFGYRPKDPKVAVIRSPREGFDAAAVFAPGPRYEVRSLADGKPVHAGEPQPWNEGRLDASSGDVGWWYDFSGLRTPGSYYVFDVQQNRRSATFRIAPDVYREVLKAALRMYFYQRSGYAKRAPHAEACWTDEAAYLGPGQDREARDYRRPHDAGSARDLSGGWFDAGDANKYVTFAAQPVHQLLMAYQDHPRAFGDDVGIPESGNGLPDVIDELRWQLAWLQRMQKDDGRVLLKVGGLKHVPGAPPSSDRSPRYYVDACSASTIAAAGMYAHAAEVFGGFEALRPDAEQLRARAIRAFDAYLQDGRQDTACDDGTVLAGDADLFDADGQGGLAVVAAVYLFSITGEARFHDHVKAHYKQAQPYRDSGWSRYHPQMGEALLHYTRLPKADRALREAILADKQGDAGWSEVYAERGEDLYRNFLHPEQYHWGSNSVRASYGSSNLDMLTYRIDAPRAAAYRGRALDTLHYFHGVNPFGMVYLSNMYRAGATYSANEIFSHWFAAGTRWSNALTSECGPAPGYLAGGPNRSALEAGVPARLVPPVGQPPQKSYRDWNVGWPEASYAITEPSNLYQGAYIKLLAGFVGEE
jgi:endoglucanase